MEKSRIIIFRGGILCSSCEYERSHEMTKKIFATLGILCSVRANIIHERSHENFRSSKIFAKFHKIFAKFCEWCRPLAVICEDFFISQIAVKKAERRLESVNTACRFLYLQQNKSRIMQQRSVDHTLSMTDWELIKEFRMNQEEIEEICDLVKGEMQPVGHRLVDLTLKQKVLLCLKTLGSGSFQTTSKDSRSDSTNCQ